MPVEPECGPGPGEATGAGAGAGADAPLTTADLALPPDPELDAAGWKRRNLSGPDKVQETVELYESLGFEVMTKPLTPADFGPKCFECALVACRSYRLIYTRRKGEGGAGE